MPSTNSQSNWLWTIMMTDTKTSDVFSLNFFGSQTHLTCLLSSDVLRLTSREKDIRYDGMYSGLLKNTQLFLPSWHLWTVLSTHEEAFWAGKDCLTPSIRKDRTGKNWLHYYGFILLPCTWIQAKLACTVQWSSRKLQIKEKCRGNHLCDVDNPRICIHGHQQFTHAWNWVGNQLVKLPQKANQPD